MLPRKRKSEKSVQSTQQKRISSYFVPPISAGLEASDCKQTGAPKRAVSESQFQRETLYTGLQDGTPSGNEESLVSSTILDSSVGNCSAPTHEGESLQRQPSLLRPSSLSLFEDADSKEKTFCLQGGVDIHDTKQVDACGSECGSDIHPTRKRLAGSLNHVADGVVASESTGKDRLNVLPWLLKPKAPKGHHLVANFITPEEERYLLHCLDNDVYNPWKVSRVNGVHLGKAFGVISVRRSFADGSHLPPMPKFVKPFVERMRNQVPVLKEFEPNEMNAIDYRRSEKHWLKPHMDDRQLSGQILVNLSLGGTCVMSYAQERGAEQIFRVRLAPCSLQILTGESRYSYTHGIHKGDIISPRRVSMTFRQSIPLEKASDR